MVLLDFWAKMAACMAKIAQKASSRKRAQTWKKLLKINQNVSKESLGDVRKIENRQGTYHKFSKN